MSEQGRGMFLVLGVLYQSHLLQLSWLAFKHLWLSCRPRKHVGGVITYGTKGFFQHSEHVGGFLSESWDTYSSPPLCNLGIVLWDKHTCCKYVTMFSAANTSIPVQRLLGLHHPVCVSTDGEECEPFMMDYFFPSSCLFPSISLPHNTAHDEDHSVDTEANETQTNVSGISCLWIAANEVNGKSSRGRRLCHISVLGGCRQENGRKKGNIGADFFLRSSTRASCEWRGNEISLFLGSHISGSAPTYISSNDDAFLSRVCVEGSVGKAPHVGDTQTFPHS